MKGISHVKESSNMKQPEQTTGKPVVWSLWHAKEWAATKVNRRMKASKREKMKVAKIIEWKEASIREREDDRNLDRDFPG
jgi:hypothetical protein